MISESVSFVNPIHWLVAEMLKEKTSTKDGNKKLNVYFMGVRLVMMCDRKAREGDFAAEVGQSHPSHIKIQINLRL